MARMLVTGATGFIGRHLVERLADDEDDIRCLVREPSVMAGLGVELMRGDVTDRRSLDEAVQGVDVVYHLAGRTLALSSEELHLVNAEGTRNLAAACASRTSPPILVFVSSLAAAGPSNGGRPLVEEDEPAPVSEYGRSKRAAELILQSFADSVPITVFRPPGVFGPRERHMLALFRSVNKGWNVVPVRTPLQMSFIYVEDLVEGLLLGAERGARLHHEDASRGYYYVGFDASPTYAELSEMIAQALGRESLTTVRLPSTIGFAVAGVSEVVAKARRRPSLLNLDKMTEAAAGSWTCDSGRAVRELGFHTPRTFLERLQETAEWYRAEGWL
jgi:nucleoside-diphosphate-sugar epimerase